MAATKESRLKAKQKLEEIMAYYRSDKGQQTFNAIIAGDMGTGKTTILRTARKPVLVHSFDPGGTKVLRPEIEKGLIIPDTRFEAEDPKNPTAFRLWEQEFKQLRESGVFEEIGTFAIDSITTFADALMNEILRKAGRSNGVPYQQDYLVQINVLRDYMKILTTLPCDVILTAHLDPLKDELTGKVAMQIMVTGKLRVKIPLLFDEIYVATTKRTSKGVEYVLLTRNDGYYQARTRIGRDVFETYEKPDIEYLLKKAGMWKEGDKA